MAFIFAFSKAPEAGLTFRAFNIAAGYLLFVVTFLAVGRYHARHTESPPSDELQA